MTGIFNSLDSFPIIFIKDYRILFLEYIISFHKHGYYQMITIYGILMRLISRKNIHLHISLNQSMERRDKGKTSLNHSATNIFFVV
jgi:hypothetical protein